MGVCVSVCVSVICLVEIALEQLEGATSTSTSAATATATQPRSAIREKAATVVDVETQLIAHCNKQKSLTPPFPLPQAPQHCFQVFTPASVAPSSSHQSLTAPFCSLSEFLMRSVKRFVGVVSA